MVSLACKKQLLSDELFSVDGTLIQAWASQKSYRRKDDDSIVEELDVIEYLRSCLAPGFEDTALDTLVL